MTTQTTDKPARYLFDEVFALEMANATQADPMVSTTVHEAAVTAAREEGYAKGVADGRRLAEETIAKRIADSLAKLTAGLDGLVKRAAADRLDVEVAAVEMAQHAASRLAPQLVAREPAAELAAMLRTCMAEVRDVPHIAIRVSEDLVEDMRAHADRSAAEAGFAGTVIVLGDPDIAPGDGRIEWADGGVVRNMPAVMAAIDVAVTDYLAAKGRTRQVATPADETPSETPNPEPGNETNE